MTNELIGGIPISGGVFYQQSGTFALVMLCGLSCGSVAVPLNCDGAGNLHTSGAI